MSQSNKSPGGVGCAVALVVVVVIAAVAFFATRGAEAAPTVRLPTGATVTKSAFTNECRARIRGELALPHTANFLSSVRSGFAQAQAEMANPNIFTQRFEVDAQNAFGATIRTRWRCALDGHTGEYMVFPD